MNIFDHDALFEQIGLTHTSFVAEPHVVHENSLQKTQDKPSHATSFVTADQLLSEQKQPVNFKKNPI